MKTYHSSQVHPDEFKYCPATGKRIELSQNTSDDDFVDLGLSVKWAKCNLGAKSPEEYGNYYAWGETKHKDKYSKNNSRTYGKSMFCIGGNPEYDAATASLGQGVRMPTKEEIGELIDECPFKWITQNGVYGQLVTGPNGNCIFLPAAGFWCGAKVRCAEKYGGYWSATPDVEDDNGSFYLVFFGNGRFDCEWGLRFWGHSVRPVREIKV